MKEFDGCLFVCMNVCMYVCGYSCEKKRHPAYQSTPQKFLGQKSTGTTMLCPPPEDLTLRETSGAISLVKYHR